MNSAHSLPVWGRVSGLSILALLSVQAKGEPILTVIDRDAEISLTATGTDGVTQAITESMTTPGFLDFGAGLQGNIVSSSVGTSAGSVGEITSGAQPTHNLLYIKELRESCLARVGGSASALVSDDFVFTVNENTTFTAFGDFTRRLVFAGGTVIQSDVPYELKAINGELNGIPGADIHSTGRLFGTITSGTYELKVSLMGSVSSATTDTFGPGDASYGSLVFAVGSLPVPSALWGGLTLLAVVAVGGLCRRHRQLV